MKYVSLALSDTMFPEGQFRKTSFTVEDARDWLRIYEHDIVSACNPSHKATFDALNRRFSVNLPVPEKAPVVALSTGDEIMVFQARLPRLAEGETHTDATVNGAQFTFSLWSIL